MYDVRSTNGNTRLGGNNIDSYIVDYCVEHLLNDFYDIASDKESMERLKIVCEEAKKQLSSMNDVKVLIDWHANFKFEVPINIETFNNLIEKLVSKTLECVERVIKDANLKKSEIDEVILIGGSILIQK